MNESFTQNQFPMNGNTSYGNQQLLLGHPYMSAVPPESSILGQKVSFPLTPGWDDNKKTDSQDLNSIFESLNPITAPNSSNGIMGSLAMVQNSPVANDDNFNGQFHGATSQITGKQNGVHEQVTLPQDDSIPNNMESMVNSITTKVRF